MIWGGMMEIGFVSKMSTVNMALTQKCLKHSPTDYPVCIYVITQQLTQFILISHRTGNQAKYKLELQEITAIILWATGTFYEIYLKNTTTISHFGIKSRFCGEITHHSHFPTECWRWIWHKVPLFGQVLHIQWLTFKASAGSRFRD